MNNHTIISAFKNKFFKLFNPHYTFFYSEDEQGNVFSEFFPEGVFSSEKMEIFKNTTWLLSSEAFYNCPVGIYKNFIIYIDDAADVRYGGNSIQDIPFTIFLFSYIYYSEDNIKLHLNNLNTYIDWCREKSIPIDELKFYLDDKGKATFESFENSTFFEYEEKNYSILFPSVDINL